MSSDAAPGPDGRSALERMLGIVTEVKAGEGVTALLLTFNVFILLSAYYVIKPVREALILAMEGGAEYKAYMSAAIAVSLLFVVPAYAAFANRVARNRLVVSVTLFFASNLVLFYVVRLVPVVEQNIGLLFYLWVGIFNLMVVAQFWAFANDVYTEEQGKRLFALIGIGASVGAAAGSGSGIFLAKTLGVYQMLLVSAVMLVVFAFIIQLVHSREHERVEARRLREKVAAPSDAETKAKESPEGAFEMVRKYRYLTLMAIFSIVFTVVNSNGEYMLGRLISESAKAKAAAGTLPEGVELGDYIGSQFSQFFFFVNVLGVVLQTFVVSRLVKYGGLRVAFFVLPVIALLDAGAVAIMPVLAVLFVGKIAENGTDYSINNTVRNMLWLPTTAEMKYKAKQAVDTFFVRIGDVSSAGIVFVLAGMLALDVRAFAITNLVIVAFWLWLAGAIIREQGKLKQQLGTGEPKEKAA